MGRFREGTEYPTIVIPPEKMAVAPTPATAQPMISIREICVAVQRMEPPSKMMIAMRYVHLMLKYVYTFPKDGGRDVVVSKYADPHQPTSSSELKTGVMRGMAVAMMVLSSAMLT